jgi:hypothetical protein
MSFDTARPSIPEGNGDRYKDMDESIGTAAFLKPEKKRLQWNGLTCAHF